ncbi:MAG: hypothetical protein P8Y23_16610 [Candidatus Lokiarchaeota archaeon]
MSKLSDGGLIVLIIATGMITFSLILYQIILPLTFIYIQIIGWSLVILSIIIGIVIKGEYHTIKLKTGFELKINHIIILICALFLSISLFSFIDILNFTYTGKFTYFALIWTIVVLGIALGLYLLKKRKQEMK